MKNMQHKSGRFNLTFNNTAAQDNNKSQLVVRLTHFQPHEVVSRSPTSSD